MSGVTLTRTVSTLDLSLTTGRRPDSLQLQRLDFIDLAELKRSGVVGMFFIPDPDAIGDRSGFS